MRAMIFLCFLSFLISTAVSIDTDNVDGLAMELTGQLLERFNKNQYRGFDNFHVRFVFDDCKNEYETSQFIEMIPAYRKSLASGTVIKYKLLKASTLPRHEGITFSLHFDILGNEYDIDVSLEWKTTSTGNRWVWHDIRRINCLKEQPHGHPSFRIMTGQKVLS